MEVVLGALFCAAVAVLFVGAAIEQRQKSRGATWVHENTASS
jgi:hypothetical protein